MWLSFAHSDKHMMKFTLSDLLLLLIPIAFVCAYVAPWLNRWPIEWQQFSTERLGIRTSEGKTVLILFKPRLGVLNDLAMARLNHPAIQRAIHSGRLVAMEYEFGYAESIPVGEEDEIEWLMAQPVHHKDAFAVIVLPNGTTLPVDPLDPNDLIRRLSLESNSRLYLWLAIASSCVLIGRAMINRKSRDWPALAI
jgi:hypothetical protein